MGLCHLLPASSSLGLGMRLKMPDCRRKASRAQGQAWRSRTATLVWLWQSRQWSRAPTPAQSLWRLQRHSVEQLRPTKPKWQRQWSGSTHEPFTQPWAHTGRHSPVTLRGGGGGQGRAAAAPSPGQTWLASGSSQLLRAHPRPPTLFSASPPCPQVCSITVPLLGPAQNLLREQ